jgi:putative nucleotidyltransferase with HDIG domain
MVFVPSGAAAITEMTERPAQVVVTDMRMPEMDGAELLRLVRDRWPETARVILSGDTDRVQSLRAVESAHQFLTKPCDTLTLRSVLARAASLSTALADSELHSLLGGVRALPALPATYLELERVAADPAAGTADIARVVEGEPAATAKLLQVVNSSFFGLAQPVRTVDRAAAVLGMQVVRALVLASGIAERFEASGSAPSFSMTAYHAHGLNVARLAAMIPSDRAARDGAFLGGVLHDVGKLVMATRRPEIFERVAGCARDQGLADHAAERSLGEPTHAAVGAYLLALWGLPVEVVDAVATHHTPARYAASASSEIVLAVHVADALVHEVAGAPSGASRLDLDFLAAHGATARLSEWRARARDLLAP